MRPNILLINCDDLGYGDLGCYGSTKNDTPFLDELAAKGRLFTDFYMASPVCTPSRGSLLTGCYPPRIGFGSFNGDRVLFPGDAIGLNTEEFTMGKLFKKAGYATFCVGKWHVGDQEGFLPTDHGFDEYFGLPYSNDAGRSVTNPDMAPLPLIENDAVIQEQPDQRSLTERYVEKSCAFIRDHKDEPVFLYFAHMHVHRPLYVADSFVKASRNGDYGACVAAIDWATKSVVQALKKYGLFENTLIIFTSDNGSRNDFGESNGPLRGRKGDAWEGGLRVPFIVHGPGVVPGITDALVTAMDLLPTFAKMLGVELPADKPIDGIDMCDVLLGRTDESPRKSFNYYVMNNLEAVRVGDWKLFVSRGIFPDKPPQITDGVKPELGINNFAIRELYNLKNDVGETNNVADLYPEIEAELMEYARKARSELGDQFTHTKGTGVRAIGRVKNPRMLTEYDIDHPYICAMYDNGDVG